MKNQQIQSDSIERRELAYDLKTIHESFTSVLFSSLV